MRSIGVPACDALYKASIISGSTRLFIFAVMRPSGPSSVWRSIRFRSSGLTVTGATSSLRYWPWRLYPVR